MEPYTQANKKKEMAQKMGLTMHGKNMGEGGGMKYRGIGKEGSNRGGMKPKMNGVNSGKGRGMKYPESNGKANFSPKSLYDQNGK